MVQCSASWVLDGTDNGQPGLWDAALSMLMAESSTDPETIEKEKQRLASIERSRALDDW